VKWQRQLESDFKAGFVQALEKQKALKAQFNLTTSNEQYSIDQFKDIGQSSAVLFKESNCNGNAFHTLEEEGANPLCGLDYPTNDVLDNEIASIKVMPGVNLQLKTHCRDVPLPQGTCSVRFFSDDEATGANVVADYHHEAGWTLVFRQSAGTYKIAADWLNVNPTRPDEDNFSILDKLEDLRSSTSGFKFEFKMMWPGLDARSNFNVWKHRAATQCFRLQVVA
jgi:hypothetical protein